MGLFEKAGRKFESFVQSAEEAADETAAFECSACETRFHTAREACPECGGDVIQRETED